MCREPEQRYVLLENQAPLRLPVQSDDNLLHLYGTEETTESSAVVKDVSVGNFMQGHKHRCKNRVHRNADSKSNADLSPREFASKQTSHRTFFASTDNVKECRYARLEDYHCHADSHTEYSPDNCAWQYAEPFLVVHSL